MRFKAIIALFIPCLLAMGQAHGQAPRGAPALPAPVLSDNAKAVLGNWEFSNADRDRICMVTLKPEPAAQGFKIEFDDRCAGAFALVNDVVAWRLTDNDLLRFVDAGGKPVAEFSEVEGGIYEAPTPGYGVLFLQAAASIEPPAQGVDQVAGDWTFQRGTGKPICTITLDKTDLGEDSHALALKPGCDAQITRFNPASWRMDRGELVITAKNGDTWRFEESDNATWRHIPNTTDGLVLSKK